MYLEGASLNTKQEKNGGVPQAVAGPVVSRRTRGPNTGEAAVTGPVGAILLVGIVVILVAVFALVSQSLRADTRDPVVSGGRATFGDEGYWVEPTGPDPIPVAGSTIILAVDGDEQRIPLSAFAAQLGGASSWVAGTKICIIGPPPCHQPNGLNVSLQVYSSTEFVFRVGALRSQAPTFTIGGGGGLVIPTNGPFDVRLQIVGAEITCGPNGNPIPVTARLTQNGGTSYQPIFGGLPVNPAGGQEMTLVAVPPGSVLGVEGRATLPSCSGFDHTYNSLSGSDHVMVLQAGDAAPNKPIYGGQTGLASFMAPYVNTISRTMVLDPNQVIILFEFTDDLDSDAADFQDLVVLFTFG